MMKIKKYSYFFACVFLLLGGGLQGCNANPSKGHDFPITTGGYLDDIAKDPKAAKKEDDIFKTIKADFIRKLILKTQRGRLLNDCQFVATRVEFDKKSETIDWLATTQGTGHCGGNIRNYWLVQQGKDLSTKLIKSGRAKEVTLRPSTTFNGSWLKLLGGAHITVQNGDQLADGSWVMVNSPDDNQVQISCVNKYHWQDGKFVLGKKKVDASVPTGAMLDSTPEMSWQPINDPRYHCGL